LIDQLAISAIKTKLMPIATVATPNLHEAAKLLETGIATSPQEMIEQGKAICEECDLSAVLIKGGHGEGDTCVDILYSEKGAQTFTAQRIETRNTHGTGCSLSSAIAANLAKGAALPNAVESSKAWLTEAIRNADQLDIGSGAGPVHHFHEYWSR